MDAEGRFAFAAIQPGVYSVKVERDGFQKLLRENTVLSANENLALGNLTLNAGCVNYCRTRFKTVLVPGQIEKDGSLSQELRRTKPYGYSLFNLEAFSTIAQILSTPNDNLWTFQTDDGRGLASAMKFMVPYIRDKKSFPRPPDVMYDKEWPMRQSSLLFAAWL